ncbi:PEP-CTERM sorting domain-containing protein [Rubellicoccus peritrichatus]|uniref:PEP-CTERM sorting domain-containing protein n=1 Tax=Rubellicoccus peritrichatus TaxID=3080537 RepID=A0AAQ3LAF7_9BACT|nr:PEP-CTERM sorting domain-containing protein [Puniceicoccus sp. CR14]WOO40612.1 PEP-CTERM sorting domain-containing protein [Puniceicoccus sp. CR14]
MSIYKKTLTYTSGALLFCATALQAQLSITNGDFEAQVVPQPPGYDENVADWFQSQTSSFYEYVYNQPSVGDNNRLMFENTADHPNYVYQSMGTVTAGEVASGSIQFFADAIKRSDRDFGAIEFELFSGTFATPGNGNPLTGLSSLGTYTVPANTFTTDPGFAEAPIITSAFDISSLSAGTEVWLQLTAPIAGGGVNPGIDNISFSVIPEPSTYAFLGGLLAFALVMIRRRK